MLPEELEYYSCPKSGRKFEPCDIQKNAGGNIWNGKLRSDMSLEFNIAEGIPDFTYPRALENSDAQSRQEYDGAASTYDDLQIVTFAILKQEERAFRQMMVNLLNLNKGCVCLETAGGTGLNVPFLLDAIGVEGKMFLQDLSLEMLKQTLPLGRKNSAMISRSLGNAAYLPFEDNFFDAVLSFGGIGVFADQKRAISEMFRVTKPGGRIVFGDEGVAPWLRTSEYGQKLMSNNAYYRDEVPLELLPVEARDVCARWVMGGGFYLVDLTVGTGEPDADFDYPIPGQRGGTINTRYYGKLESVTAQTKQLAMHAREKAGISMHDWLERAISSSAKQELDRGEQ